MSTFTGAQSDGIFTATSAPDAFYFGEKRSVDLIFGFDVSETGSPTRRAPIRR